MFAFAIQYLNQTTPFTFFLSQPNGVSYWVSLICDLFAQNTLIIQVNIELISLPNFFTMLGERDSIWTRERWLPYWRSIFDRVRLARMSHVDAHLMLILIFPFPFSTWTQKQSIQPKRCCCTEVATLCSDLGNQSVGLGTLFLFFLSLLDFLCLIFLLCNFFS